VSADVAGLPSLNLRLRNLGIVLAGGMSVESSIECIDALHVAGRRRRDKLQVTDITAPQLSG
jgi:hypothetical protein